MNNSHITFNPLMTNDPFEITFTIEWTIDIRMSDGYRPHPHTHTHTRSQYVFGLWMRIGGKLFDRCNFLYVRWTYNVYALASAIIITAKRLIWLNTVFKYNNKTDYIYIRVWMIIIYLMYNASYIDYYYYIYMLIYVCVCFELHSSYKAHISSLLLPSYYYSY